MDWVIGTALPDTSKNPTVIEPSAPKLTNVKIPIIAPKKHNSPKCLPFGKNPAKPKTSESKIKKTRIAK